MQTHVYMSEGIQPNLESERDITVNSPGFSAAVGIAQHIEAFGVKVPMLMTQITLPTSSVGAFLGWVSLIE